MSTVAHIIPSATGRAWELRWTGPAGSAQAGVFYDTPGHAAKMARDCAADAVLQDGQPFGGEPPDADD